MFGLFEKKEIYAVRGISREVGRELRKSKTRRKGLTLVDVVTGDETIGFIKLTRKEAANMFVDCCKFNSETGSEITIQRID